MKKKKKAIGFLTAFVILLILGIVFAFVSLNKGQLGLVNYNNYPKQIKLGLDLKGGVYAVYHAERPSDQTEEEFKYNIKVTVNSFEKILFDKGYTEALVVQSQVTGQSGDIRVEVPNVDDPQRIFSLIGKPATVYFSTDQEHKDIRVFGKDVKKAEVTIDENGKYQISLTFDDQGTKKFAKVTQELSQDKKPLHIFIDGNLLISPTVQVPILNGKAVITGDYTRERAEELALRIQSGTLPLKLELSESDTISPKLGVDALKHGLIAGGVGLLLIFILLIGLYRKLGIAASISLLYFVMTYLFFLAILPWVQLTLAGIAGILLSIGMAVDANIIIFERIKEEYKTSNGLKSIRTCINNGFRRSLGAIIDGNVTTIMGAIVLLIFGVPSIKGFAITLLVGIFLSLFTALLISRLIILSFLAIEKINKAKTYSLTLKRTKYLVSNKDGSHVETFDDSFGLLSDDKIDNKNRNHYDENDKEINNNNEDTLEEKDENKTKVKKENKPKKETKDQSKVNFKKKYKNMDRKNPPRKAEKTNLYNKKQIKTEEAIDNE